MCAIVFKRGPQLQKSHLQEVTSFDFGGIQLWNRRKWHQRLVQRSYSAGTGQSVMQTQRGEAGTCKKNEKNGSRTERQEKRKELQTLLSEKSVPRGKSGGKERERQKPGKRPWERPWQ
ncbi:hypothetical protein ATANTOWER_031853 [Ataeniobius toweri]|uniref:Uncharacterized protein n=1 Tax=Ataeniobius toweri TaxID=208326 RepID=A0ABU7CDP1_9TELE|nr:hypothetical protein [Ataeniobius toweri]